MRPGPRRRSRPVWSTRFRAPGCGSSPTGESRKVAAALKAVYTAPNEEAAWQALTDFSASDLGGKYPETAATWARAWERFTPLPGLTGRCSGVSSLPHFVGGTPSTNSIETASYQLRKDHR